MLVPSTDPGEAVEDRDSLNRARRSRSFLADPTVSLKTTWAFPNAALGVEGEAGSDVDSGRADLVRVWIWRDDRTGRETREGRVEEWVGQGTTGEVAVMDMSASPENAVGSTSCRLKEEASDKVSLELGRLQEDGCGERNGPERSPSRRPPPTKHVRGRRTATRATSAEQTTPQPARRVFRWSFCSQSTV